MPLTKPQIKDVCLYHQGHEQCRFLSLDDYSWSTWHCNKLTPSRKTVDAEVKKHIDDCKRKGQDPTLQGRACGDNCKGYAYLPSIDQGYDIDKK